MILCLKNFSITSKEKYLQPKNTEIREKQQIFDFCNNDFIEKAGNLSVFNFFCMKTKNMKISQIYDKVLYELHLQVHF